MKKLFFSLLVAVVAIGASAFTVEKNAAAAKVATGDIWVNTDNSGNYSQILPASAFDELNCQDANNFICAYERTSVSPATTLPASMNNTQITTAKNNGLLVEKTQRHGIYEP